MVGIIPYAGLDIAAFELMRERLHERYNDRPPPQHLLLAGMLSSTGAQLVAYPLGLVRTRLQVICPGLVSVADTSRSTILLLVSCAYWCDVT